MGGAFLTPVGPYSGVPWVQRQEPLRPRVPGSPVDPLSRRLKRVVEGSPDSEGNCCVGRRRDPSRGHPRPGTPDRRPTNLDLLRVRLEGRKDQRRILPGLGSQSERSGKGVPGQGRARPRVESNDSSPVVSGSPGPPRPLSGFLGHEGPGQRSRW